MGLSYKTGFSYGDLSVVIGLIILIADLILKEKIGIGTLLNTVLIGKFVDMLNWMDIVKPVENFIVGIFVMLLGQLVLCVGCYFYISPAMGCGPRDSLMVALGKRLSKLPIGAVRGMIEFVVLIMGWALGAKVGLGSVMSMFGASIIMQMTFDVLKFDVKSVKHESIIDTYKKAVEFSKLAKN
ncbi:MAG: hypothetical protein RRY40_02395 [Oscillospiraceae bacterium]